MSLSFIAHSFGGMVYSTEPHSGEGSPLDAAVSIALGGV